jgi:hypothetical protein
LLDFRWKAEEKLEIICLYYGNKPDFIGDIRIAVRTYYELSNSDL